MCYGGSATIPLALAARRTKGATRRAQGVYFQLCLSNWGKLVYALVKRKIIL